MKKYYLYIIVTELALRHNVLWNIYSVTVYISISGPVLCTFLAHANILKFPSFMAHNLEMLCIMLLFILNIKINVLLSFPVF